MNKRWFAPNVRNSRFHYGSFRLHRFHTDCGKAYKNVTKLERLVGKITDYDRSCFCDTCYRAGRHSAFERVEKAEKQKEVNRTKYELVKAFRCAYVFLKWKPHNVASYALEVWNKDKRHELLRIRTNENRM